MIATTPLGKTASALHELAEEGKIGHIGVSNHSPEQFEEFSRDESFRCGLGDEDLARIDAIAGAVVPVGEPSPEAA